MAEGCSTLAIFLRAAKSDREMVLQHMGYLSSYVFVTTTFVTATAMFNMLSLGEKLLAHTLMECILTATPIIIDVRYFPSWARFLFCTETLTLRKTSGCGM
jgi:hypothetical protein